MGPGLLATVKSKADRTAQWAAIALGFSIPLSVAFDNVLLVLVVAGWLASGAWREKWRAIANRRVALAALALFGLLLIGTLYGERDPGDTALTLRKYLGLLWIPVLVWVFRDDAMRRRALHALAASLALVLLMSFLIMADVIPEAGFLTGNSSYPVVFKGRQTHGPLMAFAAFLYVQFALAAVSSHIRVIWLVLAALALINGTLVVQGATGYVVLGTLALYLGYGWRGWKGLGWALGAAAGVFLVLALLPGPFQQRVTQIERQMAEWNPGHAPIESQVGLRLDFYRNSLALVREHALVGVGTGGFAKAYADRVRATQGIATRNPHNEYLHIMVQLGLVGLAALLYLFWTHWRLAPHLASPLEYHLARGLILTMAVGCLFNSWLLDHTEGLLYAWLTGLLFAGLKSPENPEIGNRK
jgi:O-antigen ligase